MIGQKEPRPSARLDDGLVAFPDQSGEFVLPQILPDRKRWLQTTFAQGSSWSSFDMGQCWAILVRVSVK